MLKLTLSQKTVSKLMFCSACVCIIPLTSSTVTPCVMFVGYSLQCVTCSQLKTLGCPLDLSFLSFFEIIWDQNPFNFLFKNSVFFKYAYRYNYGVIVGELYGFYVVCFYPFLFCDLKPQRR